MNKSIKYLLVVLFFLLPLVFFPGIFLAYELPKVVFFRAIVFLIASLISLELISSKTIALPKISKKVGLAFCLYILFNLISTFFSASPHISFWGSYERQQGLLQMLFYFSFFGLILFYFANLSKNERRSTIELVLKCCCFGAFFTALYGIFQAVGADSFRAVSTIGHPNFLGLYLAVVIPWTLHFLNKAKSKVATSAWLCIFLALLIALLLTLSRGAFLGLFGACFIYAMLRKKYTYILSMGVAALLVLVLNFFADSSFVAQNGVLSRFVFQGFGGVSMQIRLMIWDSVLEMIANKPLTGFGPEMMKYTFYDYLPSGFYSFEAWGHFVDRAHNEFLDQWLQAGLFGLISYLLMVLFIFKKGFEKKKDDFVLLSTVSLGTILLANMVSFSLTIEFIFFYLFAAIVLIHDVKLKTIGSLKSNKAIKSFIAICVFFLVFLGIKELCYKPLLAEYYHAKNIAEQVAGNKFEAKSWLEKAASTNTNELSYVIRLIYLNLEIIEKSKISVIDESYAEAEKHFRILEDRGGTQISNYWQLKGRLSLLQNEEADSLKYFETAYSLSSREPELLLEYARALKEFGEHEKALKIYEEYLDILPFWRWIFEIDSKSPAQKERFRLFIEHHFENMQVFPEIIEVAKLVNENEKSKYYQKYYDAIVKHLRDFYTKNPDYEL